MRFWPASLLLPLLCACAGGAAAISAPPGPTALASSGTRSEVQSDARNSALQSSLSSSRSNDRLYIGNTGNDSITVYRHDASGNTPPLYVIAGSKTGLNGPGQLSEDAQGNLYVANGGPNSGPGVLVFAHGANGNVAPIRSLSGPLTGIHRITALTVDKKTGEIFIGDFPQGSDPFNDPILRFPPNANGNQRPSATSAAFGLSRGFASDSSGNNLIIAAALSVESHAQDVITVGKQFANGAYPSQAFTIIYTLAVNIADDPTTKTYLVTRQSDGGIGQSGIVRFAENTVGAPGFFNPPVVSTITSDVCGSQLAVAPGPNPDTYVSNGTQNGCATDAVYVYANKASGNAKPLRILSGAATLMNKPYGIYEGK